MNHYDIIIIGGGITGTAIAHECSKYKLTAALLERGTDIGIGATKGNGGVVHPGYDPTPGSLKAKINVCGANLYPQLAKDLNFGIINPGIFVIGFTDADEAVLKHKLEFGIKNGVKDLAIINAEQMRNREPHLATDAKHALYAPTATVVDPFEVAIAFAENAKANGVEILTSQLVSAIEKRADGSFLIVTPNQQFTCTYIVNAAGNHADDVASLVGISEYQMKPRHGDLLVLDKDMISKPQTVMFPCPGPDTKGIACIPTVHGNTIVGSTATMMDDKEAVNNYAPGIQALIDGVHKILPELDASKIIRTFAGLRPVVLDNNNDFFIAESKTVTGFIHAAGIQSPGVASAPAIAEQVRDLLDNAGLEMKPKLDYNPYREKKTVFADLSIAEQDALIHQNPAYGRIVCRCETVTEGEIIAAIQGVIPAHTLDAVKRRTRAGMGRCQSGFCQYKVISILSRELGLPVDDICLEDIGSQQLCGSVKGGVK
ncbi:NAD(P)/FAD-dependent oxidoreductase [Acetobacterium sp.]|jgi:glycerol-3-phosphate dehydrogenase|uniref:NAD(P)/FAD-dependent oxidoreductase n=1 Tax=Acetobacterium sp. TaxID=1872094 RepID=UPI000CBF689E|nr:NAD(P)/FAD-dependent oxidoreductase [Acetobacterium sp.]MDO9493627.1 NAD(P)/FAD-dependent oxidoreductase [Acetobacterium sp.]PKM74767.1 MAG: FAD/NAD(P)-binding oxidoreductase [Firmicutes bacterium HGW-Firmicutes-17]